MIDEDLKRTTLYRDLLECLRDEETVEQVIEIVTGKCVYCHNDNPCVCMRDE